MKIRQFLIKLVFFGIVALSQVGYIVLSMVYLALYCYAFFSYTATHNVDKYQIAFGILGVGASTLVTALATNMVFVKLLQKIKNKLEGGLYEENTP